MPTTTIPIALIRTGSSVIFAAQAAVVLHQHLIAQVMRSAQTVNAAKVMEPVVIALHQHLIAQVMMTVLKVSAAKVMELAVLALLVLPLHHQAVTATTVNARTHGGLIGIV